MERAMAYVWREDVEVEAVLAGGAHVRRRVAVVAVEVHELDAWRPVVRGLQLALPLRLPHRPPETAMDSNGNE